MKWVGAAAILLTVTAVPATAQVLLRVGQPGRSTYSELHEALQPGTPAADSALVVLREKDPAALWRRVRQALSGAVSWNDAPLALTRLAELRSTPYADSAARLARGIREGQVSAPPGEDPADLLPPLHAVELERARAARGDPAVLRDLLALVPTGRYTVGDAWVLGRLGRPASDSLQRGFLAAPDTELKVRYLTLLSFSEDESAIPLLARVYAAPDSFGVPPRYGSRASDALLWIGTRASLQALLDARSKARELGSYDDPALARGGYDFLANDSSAVISRTGKWLTDWLRVLPVSVELDLQRQRPVGSVPENERVDLRHELMPVPAGVDHLPPTPEPEGVGAPETDQQVVVGVGEVGVKIWFSSSGRVRPRSAREGIPRRSGAGWARDAPGDAGAGARCTPRNRASRRSAWRLPRIAPGFARVPPGYPA